MQDDPCHVLIVDDESDFRDTLGMLLQSHGYRVSEASTGHEALDLLLERGLQPDVVLLDHRMPGMTGADACAAIRANGLQLPVLLVSAVDEAHALAAAHGFTDAIPKPFALEHLLERIRHLACPGAGESDGAGR